MSNVDERHHDYALELYDWRRIEHITRQRMLTSYLVELNPDDKSKENETRNEQYKRRAIFYAIAAQTVHGLLGTMFRKDPRLSVPPNLEYVNHNCDGKGISIYQQSQALCDDVIRKSRAGLYVSFPPTDGAVSQADMIEGRVAATIHRLEPEQIINWRTMTVGARTKLKFVIIEEEKEKESQYVVDYYRMIRELYLDEESGIYKERHWSDEDGQLKVIAEYTPTDASGNVWYEIPFTFVGSENNDSSVDRPVMLPLVELNIGHYRNSADWEDSVWYCGQPQPYLTAITEDHLRMMKENNMYVGSRNILGVPDGGTFGFAAPQPNPLVREAMRDKIEMAMMLGARLMQPGSAPKTATEVAGIREAQHSVLSLIAANASEAYTQAMQWAGRYMGVADGPQMEEISYQINREFVAPDASPQELQQVMAGFLQGTMPMGDYVRWMQRNGYFDEEQQVEDYAEDLASRAMTE